MLMNKMMPRKLRGFTLTEAAIVLGIVGLILGAIWVAAAAVYNNLRVSTTSNQMLQIAQSVRAIHATQTTVDPLITAKLVAQAGGMPKDMVDMTDPANPIVTDVWGGTVNVTARTSPAGVANDSFSIEFQDVPAGPCADLIVRNSGTGRDSGLIGTGSSWNGVVAFPVALTTAVAQCGAVKNNLFFTFRLKS